ncbi:MAG: ribosome biogenesis GTP-binding protein YihA/YsxC [Bacilli bacterium]
MINYRNTVFVTSLAKGNAPRKEVLPEVLLVGRSNVGKSSFLNALVNHKNLARTSGKPGHTRLLNFFKVDNTFYLVDAPGYGYTRGGGSHLLRFGELMETYFTDNSQLQFVLLLLDSRHDFSIDDQAFFEFLLKEKIPVKIILTKADKLNQKARAQALKRIEQLLVEHPEIPYYFFSTENRDLIETVKRNLYP